LPGVVTTAADVQLGERGADEQFTESRGTPVYELSAELDGDSHIRCPNRPDPPANPVPGLEDGDIHSVVVQQTRSSNPGGTCADYDHFGRGPLFARHGGE
jgi:hypothetical protein